MNLGDTTSFVDLLEKSLDSIAGDNKLNRALVSDVRDWTAEYLASYREELQRFPDLENEPHWELIACDDASEPAVFVIMTFTKTQYGVLVGRDEFPAVREFAKNTESDVETAVETAHARFSNLSGPITLSISEMQRWIGENNNAE